MSGPPGDRGERHAGAVGHRGSEREDYKVKSHSKRELTEDIGKQRHFHLQMTGTKIEKSIS